MTRNPLDAFIKQLSGLPGLGPRSARRLAIHLLTHRDNIMIPLAQSLTQTANDILPCRICGNLDVSDPCHICSDTMRDDNALCIVAHVADLWAIERTKNYHGRYHVLGGLLSALDGQGPEELGIPGLIDRVGESEFDEVILALNATVDGQSTAHYISDKLKPYDVKLSRLSHGLPMGGELDYLDDGTISLALNARSKLHSHE